MNRYIPSWWRELAGKPSDNALQGLLVAVNRAGISRNDRTNVSRIWGEAQVMRAMREMAEARKTREAAEEKLAAAEKPVDLVPEMAHKPPRTRNRRKPPPATPTETENDQTH